jgi:hypothetical protein
VAAGRAVAVLRSTSRTLTTPARGMFALNRAYPRGQHPRAVARRHGVHRRTVRQALGCATPAPRKTPVRASRVGPTSPGQDPRRAGRQPAIHVALAVTVDGERDILAPVAGDGEEGANIGCMC